MKLLFTTTTLDVGGSEVLALNLALRLKERGHDIMIYTMNENKISKQLLTKFSIHGIVFHSLQDRPLLSYLTTKVNSLFKAIGLGDIIRTNIRSHFFRSFINKHNFDLICSHAPAADEMLEPVVKSIKIPLLIVEHGMYIYFIEEGQKKYFNFLQSATEIVTVSDFCYKKIKSYVGESKRITTIHNGVSVTPLYLRTQVRNELGIGNDDIAFGLVARGVKGKGWIPAIHAYLNCKDATGKKVHLILVGGSEYVDVLKEKYKNEKEIHFVGKVPDPVRYIEAIDVGLMLSSIKTEALSLAAIEFLMLGKPVIATNVGGVPEVLEFNGHQLGSLLDLKDDGSVNVELVKIEMLRFINGEKSLSLDTSILNPSLKRFSLETCTQAYEKLFYKILSENNERLLSTNDNHVEKVKRNKVVQNNGI